MSRQLLEMVATQNGPGQCFGTVLELGPGTAWVGQALLKKHAHLNLVGAGFTMAQRTQALDQAERLGIRARVAYDQTALPTIGLPDRSVDMVVSFGGLHDWQEPILVLDEVARVLKVEGTYYIGDVRQDAGWWQIPWITRKEKMGHRAPRMSMKASDLSILLAGTRLNNSRIHVAGPDLWIVRP